MLTIVLCDVTMVTAVILSVFAAAELAMFVTGVVFVDARVSRVVRKVISPLRVRNVSKGTRETRTGPVTSWGTSVGPNEN